MDWVQVRPCPSGVKLTNGYFHNISWLYIRELWPWPLRRREGIDHVQGPGSRIFIGGGGGGAQKIMRAHAHREHKTRSPLRPGPCRARLRALEALGVLMLSRAIWALFVSILIQNGIKKKPIVDQILGSATALPVWGLYFCLQLDPTRMLHCMRYHISPLQATWQGPIWIWWPCLSLCFPAASVSASLSCSYPISVWPLTPPGVLLPVGSVDTREEKDNVWCI